MLQAILESVFWFLAELLFSLFWWIILFPVVWLLSLPFILLMALFRRKRYALAVTEMLGSVHCFWKEWGMLIVP